MKALLILIVVGGLVLVGVYYFGGIASMDPAAEAQQFRNAIHEGMTWDQVVDVKPPKRYYTYSDNPQSMTGRNPDQPFDRAAVQQMVANGRAPVGFGFDYKFTGDHAWELTFDSNGKLMDINDLLTTKQLLEGKAFQQ